eukprot:TRINITY_DN524_c0_g1_i1.p1 TRINITY_DN524_c0_g1~~TRINITY_DN524_c0_g1_i1.p1  ORF type:complete len:412 (+),score=127.52 TRINITY_DN524_c0_g1_i1:135-1370(+)
MSVSQIVLVTGDNQQIASLVFDRAAINPFATLQAEAVKNLDLGEGVDPADVYFQYEDDDGDRITLSNDVDALEAFALAEDAGQDDVLLTVRLKSPPVPPVVAAAEDKVTQTEDIKSEDDAFMSDSEAKETAPGGLHGLLDEKFVLEFCDFLSDPIVRQVIPEVSASVAAAVLRRASAKDLFAIVSGNSALSLKEFLSRDYDVVRQFAVWYDVWIQSLTEDQLGKVAFQIPIVSSRLVAKRDRLHKAIFVKQKSLGKFLKITQFDFGGVDFALMLDNASKNAGGHSAGHVTSTCAVCGVSPIDGVRYRCMVCVGYDLCESCESKGAHPGEHAMMKFRSSVSGFVGLSHASALYGKKALKYQVKMMKHEAKAAKMAAKAEKHEAKALKKMCKAEKHYHKHEKSTGFPLLTWNS